MRTFRQFIEAQQPNTVYHLTFKHLLGKIKREGLKPNQPEDFPGEEEAVFLFPTKEDLEQALWNWLGDRIESMEQKAGFEFEPIILTIDISDLNCRQTTGYEWSCYETIPPDRILNTESA
jgi:hypothetical protein